VGAPRRMPTSGRAIEILGPEVDEFFFGEVFGPYTGLQPTSSGQEPHTQVHSDQRVVFCRRSGPCVGTRVLLDWDGAGWAGEHISHELAHHLALAA